MISENIFQQSWNSLQPAVQMQNTHRHTTVRVRRLRTCIGCKSIKYRNVCFNEMNRSKNNKTFSEETEMARAKAGQKKMPLNVFFKSV